MINFALQLVFHMTFTPSQKNKLAKISAYYRRIEKIAEEGNIDLDFFTMSYKTTSPIFNGEEITQHQIRSSERKSIFEQSEKEKSGHTLDSGNNRID